MIHFMVDFENVRNSGLRGCEYLNPDDQVTIFYSNTCLQIEKGKMQQIIASGCILDICKLCKTGKNAMDFYIASRIGEIIGAGYNGIIVIISNDKGFSAVQDYWKMYAKDRLIGLKPDIERGILSSGEESARQKEIQIDRQNISLEAEFEKYRERKRIQEEIKNVFANTEYESKLEKIVDIIQGEKTPRVLYLDSLKKFGRRDGVLIYNKLKQVV